MRLFVVSGRSGAGKSIALGVLEDLGFYCVDNLPMSFLPELVKLSSREYSSVAVSIDIRNFTNDTVDYTGFIDSVKNDPDNEVISIFLDADDQILIKRYEETRRLHPLSKGQQKLSLGEAIVKEHEILDPIAELADARIDTSNLSIHDLTQHITSLVLGKKEKTLTMIFESFGFKNGIAKDADFVFDSRFLPNPHWVAKLRPLTGLDQEVVDFFADYPEVQLYIQNIDSLLNQWLPFFERSNRSYLTVAIGCTGGQHRSVYIAETLAKYFQKRKKEVVVKHLSLKKTKRM
ncbi:MAG: RNase adapter RapZ [Ruminobacter sp.]|uniref:RNase adapter RapZ n=1 Tax=Ruminobacter sp. TaxID=2774296 RepID=UPI001B404F97|nr:RNase adapter RapZ [Ruminobacter sp.]MBP3748386.1 RNase adapter RapZ [Ruminobacter sp.]